MYKVLFMSMFEIFEV